MNKWLLIASLIISVSGSSALAEDQRNVTVVNGTGYGIKFLGFNNPGDNDWSDNELPPNSVLPDGNGVYVKFNTADDGCKWNFKIEWADAGYPGVVWRNIDLCRVSTVTLNTIGRPIRRQPSSNRLCASRRLQGLNASHPDARPPVFVHPSRLRGHSRLRHGSN
jgi:hypothetical protein